MWNVIVGSCRGIDGKSGSEEVFVCENVLSDSLTSTRVLRRSTNAIDGRNV